MSGSSAGIADKLATQNPYHQLVAITTLTDRHVQPHTDTDTHAHTNTHGQTQERGMHVHTHTHTIGSKMA